MPSPISRADVDLLLLIREEAVYADRIREALVFSESKIERPAVPLAVKRQEQIESRRQLYMRPLSVAEEQDKEFVALIITDGKRHSYTKARELSIASSDDNIYVNPPLDRRRTVDDDDAIYSAASLTTARVEFNYADLVAAREDRKNNIPVRALRRMANLWDINPKLNKEPMLTELIAEYIRRYPEEVQAYESRRTTTRNHSKKKKDAFRRRARR